MGIAQVFFCSFSSRWRMAVGSFRSCTVWFYPAQFQSESKFLWCFVCFQVKTAVCFQVLVSVTFCTFPSQNCCDILYVSKAKCSMFPSQNCCDVLYVSKAKLLWCLVCFQVKIAVTFCTFPRQSCCNVWYVSKSKLLWRFVRFQGKVAVMFCTFSSQHCCYVSLIQSCLQPVQ